MNQDFIRNSDYSPSTKTKYFVWKIDWILTLALLCLCSYGLFILYSASGQDLRLVTKQAMRIMLGLTLMIGIAHLPRLFWIQVAPFIYAIGLILLIIVLLFGTDAKGAQRWIVIPGVARFQPSEMMKIATPLLLASLYARAELPPKFGHLLFGLMLSLIPAVLIAKQPDLGTALLIAYSGFITIILAGLPWRYLFTLIALSIPSAVILWQFFMHSYQKRRVLTLLNPDADPLGAGWNIIQSKAAIGSGGLEGKGWLQGTQSQLDFLPESSTDFIIAVIAEELGLKGVLVLFALYITVCGRSLMIAWNANDSFGRLLAGTFTFTFFIYIFVNVGMVSGILPVVGVPLPLISYGGSSIVSLLASFGLIMAVHVQQHR